MFEHASRKLPAGFQTLKQLLSICLAKWNEFGNFSPIAILKMLDSCILSIHKFQIGNQNGTICLNLLGNFESGREICQQISVAGKQCPSNQIHNSQAQGWIQKFGFVISGWEIESKIRVANLEFSAWTCQSDFQLGICESTKSTKQRFWGLLSKNAKNHFIDNASCSSNAQMSTGVWKSPQFLRIRVQTSNFANLNDFTKLHKSEFTNPNSWIQIWFCECKKSINPNFWGLLFNEGNDFVHKFQIGTILVNSGMLLAKQSCEFGMLTLDCQSDLKFVNQRNQQTKILRFLVRLTQRKNQNYTLTAKDPKQEGSRGLQ